ncbi:3-deoxy-8-phosphooctulonate synthase [Bacteroidetes/Chlorobi group bacterium Naka2016]|jgi:2-dehydro-3-deoxyphosphooctonate aldolase (KDO 8-P synthase)|nr:MAG: 3-deoxy-8-phosphooctulonate synthase [Bacteroidetes/Chlorobi group bacterium Naka2016]
MEKFIVIAGPCVVESRDLLFEVAERFRSIVKEFDIDFYFKSSYRKANRTSIKSFVSIGDEVALEYLSEVREKFGYKILSDVHTPQEAERYSKYLDVIQIPAFLCRQTDLLLSAGKSGKIVNIKKGQFVAPWDILKAYEKVKSTGNDNVWITERGTFFGYNDLVVDFRSLLIIRNAGCPVIFDATHSLQRPSIGEQSGGFREFIFPLARASAVVGIDGLFFETHPRPSEALSDSATQLPLQFAKELIYQVIELRNKVNSFNEPKF